MALKLKQKLLDDKGLTALMDEMAQKIIQDSQDCTQLAFIGILKNGVALAQYLAKKVKELKGINVPVSYVDITLYRDDNIDTAFDPYSRKAEIPFPVTNKEIILIDDVLFTGRTVRAALTSILELGRPQLIRLAVAVDRGHRELPIRADYIGMACKTTREEGIRVRINHKDLEDGIYLFENYASEKNI